MSDQRNIIDEADDKIARLRAVLDAIDAQHQPYESHIPYMTCECCGYIWPCYTHLLINPEKAAQYPGANGGIGRFKRHFVADETTNEAEQ